MKYPTSPSNTLCFRLMNMAKLLRNQFLNLYLKLIIVFLNQHLNVYYLDGMKMTFLSQVGFIVQYNFQSQQFSVVDNSSDMLNQILSVQNYQQNNDQFILAINSTNTIFYYDQSFNKNILLQYSSQSTLQMENLDTQNMWVFYQYNKIDFYQILFGQVPSLIKSITPQTILYSIMRSNKTLILIDGQNQTAIQVFQISQNKQVTEITSTLPLMFFHSDCFWKTKDVYFSQKQDLLYIFNLNSNSFTVSYTIMQDIQIQELTQSQLTSVNSSQMYFSSEQHTYYYNQLLFNQPAVNFLNTATNNQILELKGYGIAYQYDLESRQIAKQFYFWDDFYYPDQLEVQVFLFYNFIVVQEEEKLILTGIRNGVLTIRELNLYTFEILLENQFSDIDITPNQLFFFDQPFYIHSTKTLIVQIYNQVISELFSELRELHIFSYNQINNQYNYKFSIRQIVIDVQVSQKTGDIICFLTLQQLFLKQIQIYNIYKDQNPVFVSETFYNICTFQLGFFNLNQDIIYYSDYFGGIISISLLNNYQYNLFSEITQIVSYYLSPNLSYQIFSLAPYNTVQIVSTQNNKVLQEVAISIYIPFFISYGNKVFIISHTYTLSYYDGDTNQLILYQNEYYGQILQTLLHKQNQIIFINTKISLIISLQDPNLQLQQASQNSYSNPYQFKDIQIPFSANNNWLQQMVDLNIYANYIGVIKYQKLITSIVIDFSQLNSLQPQNYRQYYLYDNKGFYYPYQKYMVIVVGYRLALISSSNFEILFNYESQILFMNLAYDIELGYMAFIDNLQDCIFNLKAISLNCITNNYPFQIQYLYGTVIQRQKQLIIFYSQYSLRVYSLKEQIYKFIKYSANFQPYSIYNNDYGSNIIIGEQKSQSFKILNLDSYTLLDTSFPAMNAQIRQNLFKV
ncbi:transmembrane protein, putative (macronuclear) [Tetrahymena thermophila SB210]|uniref:Transmembrane protein, putative n=1 Tax=Tetrahymena thermophila (strain SB210) TaxID=312017 RepID=Q22NL2_TETTS|nr:transmembrane protein, putative [Tetrahymena thermophila SB210]EAR86773.2 transmembrane protein, putative [Tetrahymena thermophila SB210]|eukprot:XP_001007018.2 transmembrane protein, putative [Tetrahymena thermophila SB210]